MKSDVGDGTFKYSLREAEAPAWVFRNDDTYMYVVRFDHFLLGSLTPFSALYESLLSHRPFQVNI